LDVSEEFSISDEPVGNTIEDIEHTDIFSGDMMES